MSDGQQAVKKNRRIKRTLRFPSEDFSEWILRIPSVKLDRSLAKIVRPIREINAFHLSRKSCSEELILRCVLLVERLTEDQLENYRRERREKAACDSENKYKESSQTSSLNKHISVNNLRTKMIKQRLRSACNKKEDHSEKNCEAKVVKCANIRKTRLKKRPNDYNKSEKESNVLLKKDSSALEMDLNEINSKDSGHQQVSRNMVFTSVAENNETGACYKSSQILKQTVKKPHEQKLVSVKNIPEEEVSSGIQSFNKQNCKQAIPSCDELGKHKYIKSVHERTKTSCSRCGCAPHKVSYLPKPQEFFSVRSKSDHLLIIRKEIKSIPKSYGGDNEKSGGSVTDHDGKRHKRAENSSSDRLSMQKSYLCMSKNGKTNVSGMQSDAERTTKKSHEHINHCISGVQSDVEHKTKKSCEHTNHHEDHHRNCDCKSKYGSVLSHHSSSKPKPPKRKLSSYDINKSSDCTDKSARIENISQNEGKKNNASSKECMSPNTVKKYTYKNKHSTRSKPSQLDKTRKSGSSNSNTVKGSFPENPCDNARYHNPAENNKIDGSEFSAGGYLQQQSEVATEPSTVLEDTTSQTITGVYASEIPSECTNSLSKKRPYSRESFETSEQLKIKKTRHLMKDTGNICNSASVEQQPKLPLPLLNDDDTSPGKINSNQLPINSASAPVRNQDSTITLTPQDHPPRGATNSEPNSRKIQNTLSRSENIVYGMVKTEVHDSIKREEILAVTNFKQENNWFSRVYSAHSESEIIFIDDDDNGDDSYVFKLVTSQAVPVQEGSNVVAEFSSGIVEPRIAVVYSCTRGILTGNNKLYCHENTEAIIRHKEFNLFCDGDVSLEGIISVEKCDGNEYIIIENSNFENPSVQHYISEKEIAPLKLRHIMNYFRNTLKEPKDVIVEDGRIIATGRYKKQVSSIVFLYYNYKYFFQTISNDVRKLAKFLHMKFESITLVEQMKIVTSKLDEGAVKVTTTEKARSFLKTFIEAGAPQFSNRFDRMVKKFEDFRSLTPFYHRVLSMVLFQRIVYHLYCIAPSDIHKYFLDIRFMMRSVFHGNGDTHLILSLLMERSDADFVNDFNDVTMSIRLIQSAIEFHCSGGNRNPGDSNVLIHLSDMTSSSFRDNSDVNAPVFPQSPSVTSTQLHLVNDSNQSPLMSYIETSSGHNSETTNSNDSFVSHRSMSEIMKLSNSSHPLQRIMLPVNMKSGVIVNSEIDNKQSKPQQSSANEAGHLTVKNFYSVPDSQGAVNLVMNSQNFGNTNMVSESSDTTLQNRLSGSQDSVGQESNCSLISSTNGLFRSPDGLNDLRYEGTHYTQNPAAWNTQNAINTFERGLGGAGLNSVNQMSRPSTVATALYGFNYMPGNERLLSLQNPVWNIGLHETGITPHINYGLSMVRPEIDNNILNSTMYRTAQPQVGTSLNSPFHVTEQQQMSTEPSLNPNDCAANENSTMIHSDFLRQSQSLVTFRPLTNVPLENSGTNSQNDNLQMKRMQQMMDPLKYGFCNNGTSGMLPLPLFYHDTPVVKMNQSQVLPIHQNAPNVNNTPKRKTIRSSRSKKSVPFQH